MKGLLQSKIFRKNLKKWLCMYVGALLLLTTVVTYSKYISKYNVDDDARITKFDVTVKNIENENLTCTGEIDKLDCTTKDTYRPTTKIPYEFVVTPNFEVNTLLATTIYVPASFNIERLEEIDGDPLYDEKENIKDSSITISKLKDKNEKGEEVNGDIILAIIADYMKKNNMLEKNKLVATVMSNIGLNKYANNNNLELVQTKVGDRYVLEEMLKNGGNLGGEQSGHIILSDFNLTGDGIVTSLMIIKILLETRQSFSEICRIMAIYPQTLINVKVREFDMIKYPEIGEIILKTEKELEGEGRVLIRKSGTEPLFRIMLEGKDKKYIDKAAREIANIIQEKMG